ncbi:PLC-like phosphodiesterase [Dipodascopsis tothii]|uniref:PLC-like phosphodiesterase n=1 Tax=Dipodascopsis tothii TaxID=44089 RepID=UPI0034CE0989
MLSIGRGDSTLTPKPADERPPAAARTEAAEGGRAAGTDAVDSLESPLDALATAELTAAIEAVARPAGTTTAAPAVADAPAGTMPAPDPAADAATAPVATRIRPQALAASPTASALSSTSPTAALTAARGRVRGSTPLTDEEREDDFDSALSSSPSLSVATSPTTSLRSSTQLMRRISRGAVDKIARKSKTPSGGPITRRRSSSSLDGGSPTDYMAPVVPEILVKGVPFVRVTRKKRVQYNFVLDAEAGTVSWEAKNKAASRVVVDNIKEIRTNEDARNYREEFKISSEHEPLWTTIIYTNDSGKLKGLHLIALSKESFRLFVTTLQRLLKYRSDVMSSLSIPGDRFVKVHWPAYAAADADEGSRLNFEGVEKLARRLHVNCSKEFLRRIFNEADEDRNGLLSFDQFRNFVKRLKHRDEIVSIFKAACRAPQGPSRAALSLDAFDRFVCETQRQPTPRSEIERIYRKFLDENGHFTADSLSDYLMSTYNQLISQREGNLDQPLNEYFISSSHNTYLLGRQFVGESSLEAYIRVLQRGCRCVEIDCWDGPTGPVVSHGRTFTSEVSFRDAIKTIHKYAFIVTPYPLILSFEIHCSLEQQVQMARIMTAVFGDKLLTEQLMTNKLTLPSPQELKHKILVKVKRPSDVDLANELDASGSFSSTTSTTSTESQSEDADGGGATPRGRRSRGASKIAEELAALAVYVRGIKYRNFSLPESKTLTHCFSLGERTFNSFCKDSTKLGQLEKHNQRYLMRVYPSGFRFTSSNYDPVVCWKRGVQLAALNWQTYDLGLQINDAMFAGTDRSGYVLKPDVLRSVYARATTPVGVNMRTLSFEVISAQQLPRAKDMKPETAFDSYVEVEVFLPSGQALRKRTRVVKNNGFNPIWNEAWKVDVDDYLFELVFIRFNVHHVDHGLLATYCARASYMNEGYRHITLNDVQGEQFIFSSLFVRFSMAR